MQGDHGQISFDLLEELNGVRDEMTFLRFLKLITDDFRRDRELEQESPSGPYGPSVLGWQNTSIDSFLEAGVAWADAWAEMGDEQMDIGGIHNPWRRCAAILLAGKYYE